MKHRLELEENLTVKQAEILFRSKKTEIFGISKPSSMPYTPAKRWCLPREHFSEERFFVGDVDYESGPDGMFPATSLSLCLKALGVPSAPF